MNKRIIIIGAGIAGLSAGCYARMNGFDAEILELHSLPGGLCTSWKRSGYLIDGCIHWLVGTNPNSQVATVWRELGALKNVDIYHPEEVMRYESNDGKIFVAFTDLSRLEQEMIRVAPEDEQAIQDFISETMFFARFTKWMPKLGKLPRLDQIGGLLRDGLPFMMKMRKYASISIHEYAERFKNQFLRKAFVAQMDMPDFPMAAVFLTLAWRHVKDAGYPIGGSLAFAKNIENRYLQLGGKIHYKKPVKKILVKDGKAVGVRTQNDEDYYADYVISAADGYETLFKMLGNEYLTDEVRSYYETMQIFPPLIHISFGVTMDTSQLPDVHHFELDHPVRIAEKERHTLGYRNLRFDPTLAPNGKGIIQVLLDSDYDYWCGLVYGSERYEAEKKDVAIKVLQVLDKKIPHFSEKIEMVDVATPLTFKRYTNNWKGSMEGWLLTKKSFTYLMDGKGMKKTLPSVDNFMMIGQWVEPGGGIPTAAMSARNAIEAVCRKEKKRFYADYAY